MVRFFLLSFSPGVLAIGDTFWFCALLSLKQPTGLDLGVWQDGTYYFVQVCIFLKDVTVFVWPKLLWAAMCCNRGVPAPRYKRRVCHAVELFACIAGVRKLEGITCPWVVERFELAFTLSWPDTDKVYLIVSFAQDDGTGHIKRLGSLSPGRDSGEIYGTR